MSKLTNLRKGIPDHKVVNFPGTDEKVALVELNNKEIIKSREMSMSYIEKHTVDMDTVDLIFNMHILLKSMRNPDNLEEYFASDFKEIQEHMNPKQVYELHGIFLEVQNGKTPEFDEISIEEFEDIKKKLEITQLSELDGELQTILKYFHQTLVSKGSQMDS